MIVGSIIGSTTSLGSFQIQPIKFQFSSVIKSIGSPVGFLELICSEENPQVPLSLFLLSLPHHVVSLSLDSNY